MLPVVAIWAICICVWMGRSFCGCSHVWSWTIGRQKNLSVWVLSLLLSPHSFPIQVDCQKCPEILAPTGTWNHTVADWSRRWTPQDIQKYFLEICGFCLLDWSHKVQAVFSGNHFYIHTEFGPQTGTHAFIHSFVSLPPFDFVPLQRQKSQPAVFCVSAGNYSIGTCEWCKSSACWRVDWDREHKANCGSVWIYSKYCYDLGSCLCNSSWWNTEMLEKSSLAENEMLQTSGRRTDWVAANSRQNVSLMTRRNGWPWPTNGPVCLFCFWGKWTYAPPFNKTKRTMMVKHLISLPDEYTLDLDLLTTSVQCSNRESPSLREVWEMLIPNLFFCELWTIYCHPCRFQFLNVTTIARFVSTVSSKTLVFKPIVWSLYKI